MAMNGVNLVRDRRTAGDGVAVLSAVLAAAAIGLCGSNTLPLLLGAIIEGLGVHPWEAGLVGSVELGGVALAAMLVAPRIARISRVRIAIGGAALATLAQLLSALAESYPILLATRALAGVGEGFALAAGTAAVAASANPDRLYARMAIAGGLGAAGLLALLPLAITPWGYPGGYLVLAGIYLLAMPLLHWLPAAPTDALTTASAPNRAAARRVLFGIAILSVGQGGLWAFAERIGVGIGVASETIGTFLGGAALVGLLGAGISAALDTRLGRAGALAVGLLGIGTATLGLAHASTPTEFTASAVVWMGAFLFTLPYVMGTAAALDAGGRWVAVATGMSTIGTALGPILAGLLATRFGYPALGWFATACTGCAIAAIVPVGRRLDRY